MVDATGDPLHTTGPRDAGHAPARDLAALLTDMAPQLAHSESLEHGSATQANDRAAVSELVDPHLAPRRGKIRTIAGELVIGYGLALGFELLLCGGRMAGHELSHHPYWLVILPVAAARGLGPGLAAAAVGAALLIVGALVSGHADSPAEALHLDQVANGSAFLLIAFVLGWLRDEIREQQLTLWNRHLDLASAHEVTMRIEEQLLASNRRLKLRLLDQTAQFGSLIDVARTLRDTGESDTFELLLQLVEDQCGAVACSVLRVRPDDGLSIAATRGWDASEEAQRLEAAEHSPLVQRARMGASGEVVDAFSPGNGHSGSGPLAVAPLMAARGRVTALLCIDELPPHRFTAATTSLLASIAEWSTNTGREAPGFASLAVDEHLGTPHELAVRLKNEVGRVALTGEVATVLIVQLEGGDEADRATAAVLLPELLHGSDGIYATGVPLTLALVMPATPLHAARQAGRRLAARLQAARPPQVTAAEFTVVEVPASLHDVESVFDAMAAALGDNLPTGLAEAADHAHGLDQFLRDLRSEAELATRTGRDLQIALVQTSIDNAEALDEALAATAADLEPPAVAYRTGDGRALVMLPAVRGDEAFAIAMALEHEARARGADPKRTRSEVLALGDDPSATLSLLDRLANGTAASPGEVAAPPNPEATPAAIPAAIPGPHGAEGRR